MNLKKLEKEIEVIFSKSDIDVTNDNANSDGKSLCGVRNLVASAVIKEYSMGMLNKEVAEKFKEGFIHIHDFDYYSLGATTCCQIPLGKILKDGFKIDNCFMREPQSIHVAAEHCAIIFQTSQNNFYGGQSIPSLDFDLAPYVEKTFQKHRKDMSSFDIPLSEQMEKAMELTIKETENAMEGLIHNLNSMHSRGGNQIVFSSLNFGLDTTWQGRLITKSVLKAQLKGLGDGATPIFPILIFKVKDGINSKKGEINYDLYELSLECLSKRLFPNFLFIDAKFNNEGFKLEDPNTHVATMGCRTRVFGNINGDNFTEGRGNLSFTTLNLPMIAQEFLLSNTEGSFEEYLNNYIDLVIGQLHERYLLQKSQRKEAFSFLYDKCWTGSEDHEDEVVGDLLDNGSLSLGFIGLAETLKLLYGKHHAECEVSRKRGEEIISHLRERMDKEAERTKLNYSLLATPAEGMAGSSLRKFVAKFGVIKDVSDKEFFTNSFHVPVYHNCSYVNKIRIESPYHDLCNAGHITYVEMDGNATKNLEGLNDVVQFAKESGIGYFSVNLPIDRCRECGYDDWIDTDCPRCGSSDISRIRRITGYLVGDMERWSTGKRAEERMRVKHY